MKKFIVVFSLSIIALILSIIILFKLNEEQIVEKFKKQIIDKTDININFRKIHLSVIKNFPYCSFVLDDTYIFYSKEKNADTLLYAKVLSFKVNTINLFQDVYEFPEIIVFDGFINIKTDKIGLLFQSNKANNSINPYIIKTKRIKIKKCLLNYYLGKSIKLNFHIRNVVSSGTFLRDALALKLTLMVDSFTYRNGGTSFKDNNPISVSTNISEKNDFVFTENGNCVYDGLNLGFSVSYSFKTDNLKASLTSRKIQINKLGLPYLKKIKNKFSDGSFSFDLYYTTNLNEPSAQKLTIKYDLNNIIFTKNQKLNISNLSGTTTFLSNFENNNSEITSFNLSYSGLTFSGSAKIKGLPEPYILVDTEVTNKDSLHISPELSLAGCLNGKLKLLGKIVSLNDYNDSTLKIIKLNSILNVSNLSSDKINFVKKVSGTITLDENHFRFKGSGILYNSAFMGELDIPNFLDELINKKNFSPKIALDLDRLNLDSVLAQNEKPREMKLPERFQFTANIRQIHYKNAFFNRVSMELVRNAEKYDCSTFSVDAFSGKITGSFLYSQNEGMASSILFQKIDVQNLFKTMNNFDQNIITHENITGSLSGGADLSFKYDKGKLDINSLNATTKILLENGKLNDLKQFYKLSKFLSIKEVETVDFKTLENNILIEKGTIYVPLMKISSNAINLQLTGQHNFNGEFNYLIKVSLKEILAKKFLDKNKYSTDYERADGKGLNVYLRFSGDKENYKFGFDKKSSLEKVKNNFKKEGITLKSIVFKEFNISKKDSTSIFDANKKAAANKNDTIHNKIKNNPFKIEWDEIDSTKKR
jgi:hypothetical protein